MHLVQRELCIHPCAGRRQKPATGYTGQPGYLSQPAPGEPSSGEPPSGESAYGGGGQPTTDQHQAPAHQHNAQPPAGHASATPPPPPAAGQREAYEPDRDLYPVPSSCELSRWSAWSSCFGDCSLDSYANRTRTLLTFRPECLHVPLVQQRVCDQGCQLPGQADTVGGPPATGRKLAGRGVRTKRPSSTAQG